VLVNLSIVDYFIQYWGVEKVCWLSSLHTYRFDASAGRMVTVRSQGSLNWPIYETYVYESCGRFFVHLFRGIFHLHFEGKFSDTNARKKYLGT
jgi:hypothetical protein